MPTSLSREQLRRVDQDAVSQYGMSSLILMENAGRGAAELIHQHYGAADHSRAIIICGPGNNGGDGCVIARHLHNRNWQTTVFVSGELDRLAPDTHANLSILEKMAMDITMANADQVCEKLAASDHTHDVIVDCLLGTGFTGDVRSPTDMLIRQMNHINKRATVAIDLPSGLDCDTGKASNATIRADLTITFVAKKIAFDQPDATNYTGRIEVTDIGAPRELIAKCAAYPRRVGNGH